MDLKRISQIRKIITNLNKFMNSKNVHEFERNFMSLKKVHEFEVYGFEKKC